MRSRATSPTALRLPASRQAPAPDTRGRRRRWLRGVIAGVLGSLGWTCGPGLAALAGSWVGASAIAGAATADIRDGLVAEYRFEESSGTVAADSSGHHFHGRIRGTPQWVPGSYGHGLKLDGRQDDVSVEHREALNVSHYTLTAWGLSDGDTRDPERQEMVEKAGVYWLNIRVDSQRLRAGGRFGGCQGRHSWQYLDTDHTVPYHTWTHVASTYDGHTLRIYLNGVLAASMVEPRPLCHALDTPLIIGAKQRDEHTPAEAFFSGMLDEVRLYARALSPADIQAVMRATTALTPRASAHGRGGLPWGVKGGGPCRRVWPNAGLADAGMRGEDHLSSRCRRTHAAQMGRSVT